MNIEALQHLRSLVQIMERCEPDVPEAGRASDEEWVAALAAAQAFLYVGIARQHTDDLAVDRFAAVMKAKLAAAREKGRGGWEEDLEDPDFHREICSMLRAHVDKGDPVDVANFCMFLQQRGQGILSAAASGVPEAHKQLATFYCVKTLDDLVAAMGRHITRLQAKLPPTPSLAPQRVREG